MDSSACSPDESETQLSVSTAPALLLCRGPPESIQIWKRSIKLHELLRQLASGRIPMTHEGLDGVGDFAEGLGQTRPDDLDDGHRASDPHGPREVGHLQPGALDDAAAVGGLGDGCSRVHLLVEAMEVW